MIQKQELFAKWIAPKESINEFQADAKYAVNGVLRLSVEQESVAEQMFRIFSSTNFPKRSDELMAVAVFASFVNSCGH